MRVHPISGVICRVWPLLPPLAMTRTARRHAIANTGALLSFRLMRHRLFTALARLSLTLCAATGVAYLGTLSCNLLSFNGGPPIVSSQPVLKWWSLFFGLFVIELRVVRALRDGQAADRRRDGRCVRCGYVLRATPGRCPECGTAAEDVAA
jgi:hypothetical protein